MYCPMSGAQASSPRRLTSARELPGPGSGTAWAPDLLIELLESIRGEGPNDFKRTVIDGRQRQLTDQARQTILDLIPSAGASPAAEEVAGFVGLGRRKYCLHQSRWWASASALRVFPRPRRDSGYSVSKARRQTLSGPDTATPSHYWSALCDRLVLDKDPPGSGSGACVQARHGSRA